MALEKAIDDATEAEKRRQAALMASTKIGVEDDPMLARIAAHKRGQDIITEDARLAEEERASLNAGFWEQYLEAAEVTMSDFQELTAQVANNFASSLSSIGSSSTPIFVEAMSAA